MLGRLTRSQDFERALGRPACAHSRHFAVHFIPEPANPPVVGKLSTTYGQACTQPVDDLPAAASRRRLLLGAVLPKRHARRAVTRSLLKRQIRAALARRSASSADAAWPGGICIVRLRAPFERAEFASAASDALRRAARGELDAVLASAWRRLGTDRACA